MKQLLEIVGALVFVAGCFITAILGYNLVFAVVANDPGAQPDAHGMATGLSIVGLVFIGIPALIGGWLLMQRKP